MGVKWELSEFATSPTTRGLLMFGLFANLKGRKQWEKPLRRRPSCEGRESAPLPKPAIPMGSL
ncbi:putative aspartyl protease [Iris pallida]|uniref:Aspartyl protease n=1 Tax=Iris pallida TaxID=29817 RepID=A0AAX6DYY3_IRIPA|nr:putative aspartyl protease [Iris pallida]